MGVVFDKLAFVKRLEDAGITRTHAEAMSDAFHHAMFETVATTQDVELLRRDLDTTRLGLTRDLETMRLGLTRDLDATKSTLQDEINRVRVVIAESKVWTVSVGASIVAVLAAMKYFG